MAGFTLLLYMTAWTLAVFISETHAAACPYPDDPNYVQHDGTCYHFVETPLDYDSASRACQAQGASLAAVDGSRMQEFMREEMYRRQWQELLIGLQLSTAEWHWVVDGTFLQYQGCYANVASDVMEFNAGASDAFTPETCIGTCKLKQYKYAGVNLDRNRDVVCRCGQRMPSGSVVQYCEKEERCPSNSTLRCGSRYNTRMFRVNADPLYLWYGTQPNDHPDWKHQRCLVLSNHDNYKWGDENCNGDGADYGFICEYEMTHSECDTAGYYYRADTCFSLHPDSMNWFRARERCRQDDGDLLKMRSRTLHAELQKVHALTSRGIRWWIGGTQALWQWPSGAGLTYSNWAKGEPNLAEGDCVVIKSNAGGNNRYQWDDVGCSRQFPFVCQQGTGSTTSTTTTTTTTTTTPKPTTTTTMTTTTSKPTTTTTTPTTTTTTPTTTTTTPTTTTTTPTRTTTTRKTTTTTKPVTTTKRKTTIVAPTTTTTTKATPSTTTTTTTRKPTTTTKKTKTTTTTKKAMTTKKAAEQTTQKGSEESTTATQGDKEKLVYESDKVLRTGVIIAIVITAVTVIFAFIKLVIYFCRRSRTKADDMQRLAH